MPKTGAPLDLGLPLPQIGTQSAMSNVSNWSTEAVVGAPTRRRNQTFYTAQPITAPACPPPSMIITMSGIPAMTPPAVPPSMIITASGIPAMTPTAEDTDPHLIIRPGLVPAENPLPAPPSPPPMSAEDLKAIAEWDKEHWPCREENNFPRPWTDRRVSVAGSEFNTLGDSRAMGRMALSGLRRS